MDQSASENHFSPVFANSYWTNEQCGWKYSYYYRCQNRGKIVRARRGVGRKAWGFEIDLYSQALEEGLDRNLENDAAILYQKLLAEVPLSADERMKWGQFIITQSIRTPSFFRYRDKWAEMTDGDMSYKETIVGCSGCHDNKYIACRNWLMLEAADGDFFVRTDNPVYMSGFVENPLTLILYPLTPRICFAACSMLEILPVLRGEPPPFPKQSALKLEKGDAYFINFELIKSASRSIILSTPDDNEINERMSLDMLGAYPQIPFGMSRASNDIDELKEINALIGIMSITDGVEYPKRDFPFAPFFGVEFSMGINPFSLFGVTSDRFALDDGNL